MRLPTFYEQNLIPNWGYYYINYGLAPKQAPLNHTDISCCLYLCPCISSTCTHIVLQAPTVFIASYQPSISCTYKYPHIRIFFLNLLNLLAVWEIIANFAMRISATPMRKYAYQGGTFILYRYELFKIAHFNIWPDILAERQRACYWRWCLCLRAVGYYLLFSSCGLFTTTWRQPFLTYI